MGNMLNLIKYKKNNNGIYVPDMDILTNTTLCGLIYCNNLKGEAVNSDIEKYYLRQKSRGMKGYGFVGFKDKKLSLRRFLHEKETLEYLKKNEYSEILFHHRIPTSNENSLLGNHPIMAKNNNYEYNYYMIHNGYVFNDETLKKKHQTLGIAYSSVANGAHNDSEALMHELIWCIEGIQQPSDFNVSGAIAFIMLQTDKTNKRVALFYGRNGNPLKIERTNESFILRSEGLGEDIDINTLYKYDYETSITTKSYFPLGAVASDNKVIKLDEKKDEEKEKDDLVISEDFSVTLNRLVAGYSIDNDGLLLLRNDELRLLLITCRRLIIENQVEYEQSLIDSNASLSTNYRVLLSTLFDNEKALAKEHAMI